MIQRFIQDEQGATSIEYALIAALISTGIIGGLTLFMNSVSGVFTSVSSAVATASP